MKRFLCLVLGICMLLAMTGCAKQGQTGGNASSIPSNNNQTEATTTTSTTNHALPIFKTTVASTPKSETDSVADTVPYGHVSAAALTDKQAQEIMAVIVPKQLEIRDLFGEWNDNTLDYTEVCPWDEKYILLTDERFTCVQDIRNYVLDVMTEEMAKKEYFDKFLDGPYDPANDIANKYIDYDGKLYRSLHSGGSGYAYTLLPETSRVVARTENSVKIEMNTLYSAGVNDGWLYTPTLVKTNNGWRIHSLLHEGRYTS